MKVELKEFAEAFVLFVSAENEIEEIALKLYLKNKESNAKGWGVTLCNASGGFIGMEIK